MFIYIFNFQSAQMNSHEEDKYTLIYTEQMFKCQLPIQ